MKVILIPSCVSGSYPDHFQYLSTTILNDTIALDAGCVGFFRSAQEQVQVRHVLLSHTHMDHVASLPIFVENAYEGTNDPVTIHASTPVLEGLQRDMFNDRVWPDFIALSRGPTKFLAIRPFEAGQTIDLEGLRITAVLLNHVVPTVGYLVADGRSVVAFVSDTGPTDAIWQHINAMPNLKAVFVEATFPTRMSWLADVSKHLTPTTLAGELRKLSRPVRVIVVHIKARFRAEVVQELHDLNLPNLEIGQFNTPYLF
jgi:ribonuclease BN (tRNA processing enzyme)